jgi:hypothetical protein
VLAKHRIIPPSFTLLVFRKKKKKKKKKKKNKKILGKMLIGVPRSATPRPDWGFSCDVEASELEGEEDDATKPNKVGSPWMGRIGSSWTQSWPRALPSVHGVAAAATIGVWGWPEPKGGLPANPSVRVSRTVGRVVTHRRPRLTPPASPLVATSIVVVAVAPWRVGFGRW